jgi:hypothetical protein
MDGSYLEVNLDDSSAGVGIRSNAGSPIISSDSPGGLVSLAGLGSPDLNGLLSD